MKIFDIIDNKITVSPEILTIKAFKDIWDKDKEKTKTNAYNDFTYIYHMCDINSPYSNYPLSQRIPSVKLEVLGNKDYKVSKEVDEGIIRYNSFKEPLELLLESFKKQVHDIVHYLNTNEPQSLTDTDKAVKVMERIGPLSVSFKTLEEQIKKDKESAGTKIRGNKSINPLFSER